MRGATPGAGQSVTWKLPSRAGSSGKAPPASGPLAAVHRRRAAPPAVSGAAASQGRKLTREMPGGPSHVVTAGHLLILATAEADGLFSPADTLIDCEHGVMQVPLRAVQDALDGNRSLRWYRYLYHRDSFDDDGVVTGARPRTADGSPLRARLEGIAEYLSEVTAGAHDVSSAPPAGRDRGARVPGGETAPARPGAPARRASRGKRARADGPPLVAWDIDGVLTVPGPAHVPHLWSGTGPDGRPAEGTVWINPEHGRWMRELAGAGAAQAWATSWGGHARTFFPPLLGYPEAADWPVIDVGVVNDVIWGRTTKLGPVARFAGRRPLFWIDDLFGGKDHIWAESRTCGGIPTVTRHIAASRGLARADIDAALAWLEQALAACRPVARPAGGRAPGPEPPARGERSP